MANLDQLEYLKNLDKKEMIKFIKMLPDEIEKAWVELNKFVLPANYIKVNNVVILGMGGSAIGGLLTKSLGVLSSKIPIEIVSDYRPPYYVDENSLVIGVSYSGGTEETTAAFREAGKKKAKLVAVTKGGELASIASSYKAPTYKIEFDSQPRAALGFTMMAVLAILCKLSFVEIGNDDVKETIVLMRGMRTKLNPEVPTYQNEAKKLATTLRDFIPVIIGAGTMESVAYRWATQINENAKHSAFALAMPELCHNWIAGLHQPNAIKNIYTIILQSKNDHERNRARANIISQILQKMSIKYELIQLHPTGSLLSEMLCTIYFGDYVSYYLGIIKDEDPDNIPEITFLKKQLSKI